MLNCLTFDQCTNVELLATHERDCRLGVQELLHRHISLGRLAQMSDTMAQVLYRRRSTDELLVHTALAQRAKQCWR